MKKEPMWYALNAKKVGIGGVVSKRPKRRKQDKEFRPGVMYAVVFFPKITVIGDARWQGIRSCHTLSETPEGAILKFMEGIAKTETWESYKKAGHRVRKIRISDLGDARHKTRQKGE